MALRPLCCSEAPRLGMSRRGAGWLPGTMTHPATQDGSVTHEETAYARASTYDDPTEDPVSTASIICLSGRDQSHWCEDGGSAGLPSTCPGAIPRRTNWAGPTPGPVCATWWTTPGNL